MYVCVCVCSARNWTTPVTVDLKSGAIAIIKQADRLGHVCMSNVHACTCMPHMLTIPLDISSLPMTCWES